MRLTVVGCSGSLAGPTSSASCYLLEGDLEGRTWRVLLDLGSGALGPLQRFVDPLSIDAVLISHLHPDHYSDISGLYVLWKYHPDGSRPPIPIWGPKGIGKQAARAYGLREDPGMSAQFDFREYDDQPIRLGPFTISVTPVAHPITAYGLRVESTGRVLAYSGDTGPCQALVELACGADLLLAEASFVEGRDSARGVHLTGRRAGEAAAQAGVGRLVLTHIPAWNDPAATLAEARAAYPGPVEVAHPGMVHQL